jgi:hypothetical protein
MFNKRYQWIVFFLLALLFAFGIHFYAIAAEDTQGQIDTLKSIVAQNKTVSEYWDNLWNTTFHPDSAQGQTDLADYFFNNVSRFFLFIGLVALIWKLGLISGQGMSGGSNVIIDMGKALLPAMILLLMLSNNAIVTRDMMLGVREYFNNAKNGILEMRITDITIGGALKDVLITQSASINIAKEVQKCSQMYQPNVLLPSAERPTDPNILTTLSPAQVAAYDYMDCVRFIPNIIESERVNGEAQACGTNIASGACAYFRRFIESTSQSFKSATEKERQRVGNGGWINPSFIQNTITDFVGGLASKSQEKQLYNTAQYWAASFMELSLFIDALFAPLALCVALIPARLNFFMGWIISFLTILLAQIANSVVIGFSAFQLSKSSTYFLSDTRFEFMLGLCAPLIAFAVVAGGGFFAARTFMGTNLAVAGAVINVASSMASSLTMSISRAMHQRR